MDKKWYFNEMSKELENLFKAIKEIKKEYEDAGIEVEDRDVILEAIARYMDFDSYEPEQIKAFLKGMGLILDNSGVNEAFKFATVFLFLSGNGFYLNDVVDILYNEGYIE